MNKLTIMGRIKEIYTEEEILRLAVEALRRNFPGAGIETLELQPAGVAGLRPDRLIRLTGLGRQRKYYAEIKTTVTTATRAQWLTERAELRYPLLLTARYINPQMAERLRQDGVEFIDAAGNAFINQPPLYIFIKGHRLPEAIKEPPPKRAFRPAGLRVIYAFLCNTGLENKPYREIAAATGVALGTMGWFMRELKETGFLLDMAKKGKKLTQKETLLQRWVTAYPEQLRPKQILGRYRGEYGWWQNKKLDPVKAQWGGEVAAARLTEYIKPQVITIYTTAGHLNEFLLENRLRRDPAGEVELLERFWIPNETWKQEDLVHPILVYADLIATGDERDIETAKMIYERNILRLIRED